VRNYTVRAARPDLNELDVDFVLHAGDDDADPAGGPGAGDAAGRAAGHVAGHAVGHAAGPGAGFAQAAEQGLRVGLLDQGVAYNPRHDHDWTLLVADESGLPAVAGICESLPDDARGVAVVEVPTAADKQEFRTPSGVELRWVVRSEGAGVGAGQDGTHAVPGQAALADLCALDLSGHDGDVYAFTIGESALATGARRHLVGERGVPKAHIDFVGYWRHGKAAPS